MKFSEGDPVMVHPGYFARIKKVLPIPPGCIPVYELSGSDTLDQGVVAAEPNLMDWDDVLKAIGTIGEEG
jgi:hypothetical protein